MDNKEMLTLLPKKKKGFSKLIFSRIGLIFLLLIIEIGILLSVYNWFTEYFHWFALVQALFSVSMIFYLFSCVMDATAKLTWLFLIMLFPVPATIMLWFTQKDIGHRAVKARMDELITATKDMLPQDQNTMIKPEAAYPLLIREWMH